jgi:hypothetical protein
MIGFGGGMSGLFQLLLSEIIPRFTAVPSFLYSVTSERSLNVMQQRPTRIPEVPLGLEELEWA